MPDAKHHHAIARQWEMLRKIPTNPPGLTAEEITECLQADGYKVNKRSVERNLSDLSTVFGITRDDRQQPYRWHWMHKSDLDVRSLTVAEAVSTRLIEELLRPLLPRAVLNSLEDRFEHARKKLNEMSQINMARWANKVRYVSPELPRLLPHINDQVVEVVHQALFSDLQFKTNYRRRDGCLREGLVLNPHALIQKGSVSYLIATASGHSDLRFFALHRMSEPVITYEHAQLNSDFDLEIFLQSGETQFKPEHKTICLVAWISNDLALTLTERPLSADQRLIHHNGRNQLHATVADSFDLVSWIMSMGPALTVLEPDPLREKIIDKIRQQNHAYGI